MFTFSSSLTIRSLIAGLALVAVSGTATADERRTLEGVVESVDYASKSVTVIEEKTGEAVTYSFEGRAPKIDVNGRKLTDMSKVKPGQEVALKLAKTTTPEPQEPDSDRFVKGEILEVNLEQNIALIRPEDGGRPQVIDLPQNLAVSGLHSGADVSDLQEGQFVTLKYSVR